jgi:hypothetical protein
VSVLLPDYAIQKYDTTRYTKTRNKVSPGRSLNQHKDIIRSYRERGYLVRHRRMTDTRAHTPGISRTDPVSTTDTSAQSPKIIPYSARKTETT